MKRGNRIKGLPAKADKASYANKTAIIVGGTGGLGRALSQHLAENGAQVVVVGQTFRDEGNPKIDFVQSDLSSLTEARRVADQLPAEMADLVIFTTGIFAAPAREETPEGIERDMAVSFLNRLVILRAIANRIGIGRTDQAFKPRVFVMGYPGTGQAGNLNDLNSESGYKVMAAHMNTVAGNEALVLDAASRYAGLDVFGLNPGLVKTAIRSNFLGKGSLKHRVMEGMIGLLTQSPEQYANRIAPLLVTPAISGWSGTMFNNKGLEILPSEPFTNSYVTAYMVRSEELARRVGDVI